MKNNNVCETIGIASTSFKVPSKFIPVRQLMKENKEYIKLVQRNILCIPKLKGVTLEEIEGVHEFSDENPGELLLECVNEVLEARGILGSDISLIIDFSTISRDKNGISICYKIQNEISADNALTIALGNGSCSSFVLAMKLANALMKFDNMKFALLIAEDRVKGNRLYPAMHILGDGASAILLEKNALRSILIDIDYYSIGKFSHIIGINHCEKNNYNIEEFENKISPIHFKIIYDLASKLLERNKLSFGQIDLFLYQNMSFNDYSGLINALGIKKEKIYTKGLLGHGHILASDLLINYHLSRKEGLHFPEANILLISSGAGFSWGVILLREQPHVKDQEAIRQVEFKNIEYSD